MTDNEMLSVLSRVRRAVDTLWKETEKEELHNIINTLDEIEDAISFFPED